MLPAKFMVVECCDAAAGSKDSVIGKYHALYYSIIYNAHFVALGTAVIDLFTLATGAELYSVPLYAEVSPRNDMKQLHDVNSELIGR